MDLPAIVGRLQRLKPIIEEAMTISGAVGLSYGVLHQGKVIHVENFGFSDAEKCLPVNSKTMFSICSMTKNLVSAALGTLVESGKLKWDTPVRTLLPKYNPKSYMLRDSATLVDFLCMRSGLEAYNVWSQDHNRINFEKQDALMIINSMRTTADLRYEWQYNNWAYEIAGLACEEVSGLSWDSILHSEFFGPLGMARTDATGDRDGLDNVAKAYMVADDCTPVEIPITPQSGKTLMGAAGGVMSCIDDLLILYSTILKACNHQFASGKTSTPNNPFKQMAKIMSAHMQFPGSHLRDSSYGLGWMRIELPNFLNEMSPNFDLLREAPVLGAGEPSKLVLAHYGSMPGSYSGVNIFPDTESAVVVLINTKPLCDLSDWITQLVCQTLFDFKDQVDYLKWVHKSVDAELAWYDRVRVDMKRLQQDAKPPRELQKYQGDFFNASETLLLKVKSQNDELRVAFEGRDDDSWALTHCTGDTFSWLASRNELIKHGRTVLQPLSYYLIRFEADEHGNIVRLYWSHDRRYLEGEPYTKN